MPGTLDFTVSEHWAPFNFPKGTALPMYILSGFISFFEQKIQGLFKDFQGHISHFSRTPLSAKKNLESLSVLVLPQHVIE